MVRIVETGTPVANYVSDHRSSWIPQTTWREKETARRGSMQFRGRRGASQRSGQVQPTLNLFFFRPVPRQTSCEAGACGGLFALRVFG